MSAAANERYAHNLLRPRDAQGRFGPGAVSTLEERFWRRANRTDDGCWLWSGYLDPAGYGRVNDGTGVPVLAHRVGYEIVVGPIPDGLHLDHLCRVRACVNPAHLEPVTQAENNRRSLPYRVLRTHCAQGHALEGYNLKPRSRGGVCCRECANEYNRAYQRRLRDA